MGDYSYDIDVGSLCVISFCFFGQVHTQHTVMYTRTYCHEILTVSFPTELYSIHLKKNAVFLNY